MPADIADNTKWFQVDASNSQAPPDGWPENQLPSTVNNSARADKGALKRFHDYICPTVTSGGSANAHTLTYTQGPTAYVQGDMYSFVAGFTNTGPTTLNVSGLGAKSILRAAGALGQVALAGSEIVLGSITMVAYDGTDFQIMNSYV